MRLARAIVTITLGALAAGCEFQHTSSTVSPSGTPTTAGAGGTGALVGLWASQAGDVSARNACSNFQWNVTGQDANSINGTFSAVCLGMFSISGNATGRLEGPVVRIVVNGNAVLPGIGGCPVTLTADGTMEGDFVRVPYRAQTCVGVYSGTETLRRRSSTTPPADPPRTDPEPPRTDPDPPRTGPGPQPSADAIDLSSVRIVLGPNVASWPMTSRITATRQIPHQLCIWHERLGRWPSGIFFDDPNTLVEGNQWIFANIGGRWYGGAADWYRPGQACKDVTADTIARDAFYHDHQEPLRSWVPRQGETFGLMSTTPARAWPAMRTLDERTNVVLVQWGQ